MLANLYRTLAVCVVCLPYYPYCVWPFGIGIYTVYIVTFCLHRLVYSFRTRHLGCGLTEAHLCAVNASLHTLLSLAVEYNKPYMYSREAAWEGRRQKTKDFRATEVRRAVHIVTVVLLAATAFVLFI